MADKRRQIEALDYHSEGKPGKIEIKPTKPYSSQRDLALAYSPGVAEPCKKIAEEKELAYKYTAKGNLVAVISNGTAVLGLGRVFPVILFMAMRVSFPDILTTASPETPGPVESAYIVINKV
mgnify:CR=1 FL=1